MRPSWTLLSWRPSEPDPSWLPEKLHHVETANGSTFLENLSFTQRHGVVGYAWPLNPSRAQIPFPLAQDSRNVPILFTSRPRNITQAKLARAAGMTKLAIDRTTDSPSWQVIKYRITQAAYRGSVMPIPPELVGETGWEAGPALVTDALTDAPQFDSQLAPVMFSRCGVFFIPERVVRPIVAAVQESAS